MQDLTDGFLVCGHDVPVFFSSREVSGRFSRREASTERGSNDVDETERRKRQTKEQNSDILGPLDISWTLGFHGALATRQS